MRGFTLIELLLSISIIGMLAAIAIPFSASLLVQNDLDIAVQTIAENFHRAMAMSRGNLLDSQWGVAVQQGGVTLFKGNSYANRETESDEVSSLSVAIQFSGITEIIFSKLLGKPVPSGTLILTSHNNESRTITINALGTISY